MPTGYTLLVKDRDGKPLIGIPVVPVNSSTGAEGTAVNTDSQGLATFTGLADATYGFRILRRKHDDSLIEIVNYVHDHSANDEGGASIWPGSHVHAHADLSGVTANQHHNQAHDINGADHTGTPLSLANGGTNKAITASDGAVLYLDADSFEVLAAGTDGDVLTTHGPGAAPTWETPGGGPGGGLTKGQTTVDFGAFPGTDLTSVDVTGQAGIGATDWISAALLVDASADHTADEHRVEEIDVSAGAIVAGTGFTIYAKTRNQPLYGEYNVQWAWG